VGFVAGVCGSRPQVLFAGELHCVSFALAIVMHHIARMLVENETYG